MGPPTSDDKKAGRTSKKGKWSFKSLFATSLRSSTLPRDPAAAGLAQRAPSSPQAAAARAAASSPPAPPQAAGQASLAAAAASSAAASPAAVAAEAAVAAGSSGAPQAGLALAGKGLVVQVIQARRLRAADSNGLSDPYVIVKVSPAEKTGMPLLGDYRLLSRLALLTAAAAASAAATRHNPPRHVHACRWVTPSPAARLS